MTTARTYNGWPVVPSTSCRPWRLPGSSTSIRLLNAPAGFVLAVFLSWFNDQIEKLAGTTLDDWGWAAPRVGRGLSSGISNHCSGTAADVNALRHVQGRVGTFTLRKRLRILAALRLYYTVLDWGGTWRSRDEMHFEVAPGTSRARVNRVAQRLSKTARGKRVLAANPSAANMMRDAA